ncbi:hypothetical protein PVAP13_9NG762577 [Panicum virgatum]|uniref:Uncharacterized protein n=1 Tax=Panicum virgatum TaxID=38727 RepID=A0A8T0N1D8_PANVG|nr:hypothetical protein PVAP13_9NG762577 [Panicum virgatum]
MERRREESRASARKAGDTPRTPRRSESAEDGEEEVAEAREGGDRSGGGSEREAGEEGQRERRRVAGEEEAVCGAGGRGCLDEDRVEDGWVAARFDHRGGSSSERRGHGEHGWRCVRRRRRYAGVGGD